MAEGYPSGFIKEEWNIHGVNGKYVLYATEEICEKLRVIYPAGYKGKKKVWDGNYNRFSDAHKLSFDMTEEEIVKLYAKLFL
jgi:hypothetical protein